MDRHELYERTVQSPEKVVEFLRSIHGGSPRALGEDFCGTAAVSRAWVRRIEGGKALAVDRDPEVLERAAGVAGLELLRGDVAGAVDPAVHGADVIFTGNFSIGEIEDRQALVRYLERSRERLNPGGVFVCDTYGGASAFRVGAVERSHWLSDGTRILYAWEQREANPFTARVVNAMHFRLERDGVIVESMEDAFVYRWRLWSVPELRDALLEAGFSRSEVRTDLWGGERAGPASGTIVRGSLDLEEGFIACVVGRM